MSVDFFPTIAAIAGLKTPDGLPSVNLLDAEARKRRGTDFGESHSIHNMTPGDPDDTLQYLWCVEDEWKLIVRFHGKDTTTYRNVHSWDKTPVRLYRIEDDPHEKHDLAPQHPEVVERLRKKLSAQATCAAPSVRSHTYKTSADEERRMEIHPPNDQTFRAIGYGNPEVKTPQLDALSAAGIRFRNCYLATWNRTTMNQQTIW